MSEKSLWWSTLGLVLVMVGVWLLTFLIHLALGVPARESFRLTTWGLVGATIMLAVIFLLAVVVIERRNRPY